MRSSLGLEQGWGHDLSRLVRAPGLARPRALTGGRQAVLFLFTIIKATIADSVCATTAKQILCLTEGACFWTGVLFQTACQTNGWYGYIAMFVWLGKIRLRLLPWVNINKPHMTSVHTKSHWLSCGPCGCISLICVTSDYSLYWHLKDDLWFCLMHCMDKSTGPTTSYTCGNPMAWRSWLKSGRSLCSFTNICKGSPHGSVLDHIHLWQWD